MSVLSWGKPTIEHSTSSEGAPKGEWKKLPIPKLDSTKLTPTAGTEQTAQEEGGDTVDSRNAKNSYLFEFDIFVKKGEEEPFADEDGVISGEHAFRVTPEDAACKGILIDRCTLRVEESYSTADGILLHYVARPLKPATGNMVKRQVITKGA